MPLPEPALTRMAIMDELVRSVAHAASLSPAQAELAVAAVLRSLAARLPSPLFGQLQSHLAVTPGPPEFSAPSRNAP